jgi:hypothetical protein
MCNLHYSCRLFTVGTTKLFTVSVNKTKFTVHILQWVTVMNQDKFQYFPPRSTSTPLSHTRLHLTNILVWIKGHHCPYALRYLYVHWIPTACILVFAGEEMWFTFISLLLNKGLHIHNLKEAQCGVLWWGTEFQAKMSRVESQWGYWIYTMTNFLQPPYDPEIDTASNTNDCQGCLLGDKLTFLPSSCAKCAEYLEDTNSRNI